MKNLVAASFIAAALAGPAIASAAENVDAGVAVRATTAATPGMIRLDQVVIQGPSGWENNFAYQGIITLKFTNMNDQPAVAITYAMRDQDGRVVTIKDVGNFPKGQTVTHQFYGLDVASDATIELEQAVFSDGSTWTNQRSLSRRQTAAQ